MKTQNTKKMIPALMVAVMVVSSVASAAPSYDENENYSLDATSVQLASPVTDMFVDLSGGIVKAIAGKFVSDILFPAREIDYARIRQDMADVTRQAITEGEITRVEGLVNGANQEALALINSTTINSVTKYNELDRIRPNTARDLNGITRGQYAKPGLAHYLSGAQAEIGMLAAMKGYAHENHDTQKEGYADTILKTRLQTHIDQVANTKADILQDRYNDRASQIGECEFQTVDYGTTPPTPRFWVKDRATGKVIDWLSGGICYSTRQQLMRDRGNEAVATAQANIGWMDKVVDNWKTALRSVQVSLQQQGLN